MRNSKPKERALTRDEYIELRIDRTLARRGPMPPELAEEIRCTLRLAYALHPQLSQLISRLRPREAPIESDDRAVNGEGGAARDEVAPRATRTRSS